MFGNVHSSFSIAQIKRAYPDQWVAVAVMKFDADGFAVEGEVIVHDADERFVWSAIKLQEIAEPIYVFHTGRRDSVSVAA